MPSDARLQIVRRFRAPPEEVFAACTDPALLRRWFGPAGFTVTEVQADARVGGRLFFRMTGAGGAAAAEGTYREVVPPSRVPGRLVLTWTWTEGPPESPPDGVTSLVTFEIEADGAGTRLTLTHEGLSGHDEAKSHEEGWTEALEKLAGILGA